MSSDPFSNDALAAAVRALPSLPPDQVEAGVTLGPDGQPIAEVEGQKNIGKGWFAEGDAQWSPAKKWSVAALFGWRKKS